MGASARFEVSFRVAVGANEGPVIGLRKLLAREGIGFGGGNPLDSTSGKLEGKALWLVQAIDNIYGLVDNGVARNKIH